MAYSWQAETAAVGQQLINVNLKYLSATDIEVSIDDVATQNYTWVSETRIKLTTPLKGGEVVKLIRRTNRQSTFVTFAEGVPFDRINLDLQNAQFLFLAQEISEGVGISDFYNDFSMHNYRITDLGTPINDNDAATKEYTDRVTSAAINSGDRAEEEAKKAVEAAERAEKALKSISDIMGGAATLVNSVNGKDGVVVINANDIIRESSEDTVETSLTSLGNDIASANDSIGLVRTDLNNTKKTIPIINIVETTPTTITGVENTIWMVLEQ